MEAQQLNDLWQEYQSTQQQPDINALWSEYQATKQTTPAMAAPENPSFFGTMKNQFVQGVSDLGDFATMNYTPSPDLLSANDNLKQKFWAGSGPDTTLLQQIGSGGGDASLEDYARVFMGGGSNSPPGKALSATMGIIPEFNAIGAGINKYVNPAIQEATGAGPATIQSAEMMLPFLGKALPKRVASDETGNPLPSEPPSGGTGIPSIDLTTYPFRHPLKTIQGATDLAGKAAKPVIQPLIRNMMEGDNFITGEGLNTAFKSDTAAEGTRLGQKFGVDFSAGELTGNPMARGIEDALANSARYGGKFAEANQQKTDAIVGNFKTTLDKIYPESVTRADVGDRLSSAYNNTVNNLIKTRREQAAKDFEAANKDAGGARVIAPTNFVGVLTKFIDEGSGDLATPAQKAATSQAKKLLSQLVNKPPKDSALLDQYGQPIKGVTSATTYKSITVKDLQNGLAAFGDGAKSNGGIWDAIATASDRRFAASAKSALEADMNSAIEAGKGGGALKNARDNYSAVSKKISDIEQTTLGKLIGGAEKDSAGNLALSPEKVADRISSMQPTELRNTLKFLDKNHPEVANASRRYVLENAFRKAQEGKGLRGEGTSKEFAKADFVKALPDKDTLNAMLKDPAAYNDILDVAKAMNRLIDYGAAKKGSQTAQRLDFMGGIKGWGKGAFFRSITSDSLAEDLLNPAKRRAIVTEIRANSKKGAK